MRRFAFAVLVFVALSVAASAAAAPKPGRQPAASRPVTVKEGIAWIDDQAIQDLFVKQMTKLSDEGKTTPLKDLVEQAAERKECVLDLPPAPQERLTPEQIYQRCRDSVLIVGTLTKCPKCSKWHASCTAGFPVTDTGIICTNFHVIDRANETGLCAMTSDGEMFCVRGVAAASARDDFALLQLDGVPDVKPVALQPNAPVGSEVTVISHPDGRFYTLTHGMVSRYALREAQTPGISQKIEGRAEWMMITADYAKGSSGSPVFNDRGAVVGMVSRTNSIYYKKEANVEQDFQMAIKMCVPSASILRAIASGGGQ